MTTTSKFLIALSIFGIGGGATYYFWNKNKAATSGDGAKNADPKTENKTDTTEGYYKTAENQQIVAAVNQTLVNNTLTSMKPATIPTQQFNSAPKGIIIPAAKPTMIIPPKPVFIIPPKPAATVSKDVDGCQWTKEGCWD